MDAALHAGSAGGTGRPERRHPYPGAAPGRTRRDIDRYLAHIIELRDRAPDARFRSIYTRRLDALLDERTAV